MAMRDLVTGGAACSVPGSSSSSNPLGALTNALLGSSSKTQERLKEIPTATPSGSGPQFYSENEQLRALPGSELDQPILQPGAQGSEFFRGFRSVDQNGLAAAWDEVQHGGPMPPVSSLYERPVQPTFEGPPQRVLSSFLHSFVESSRGGIPFRPAPLPMLGLSASDKQCIRDRSSIMARHIFADKSEDFINAQVNALLSSLDIDNDMQARGHIPGRFREMEDYWNESQGVMRPGPHPADGWVTEFNQHGMDHGGPDAWVKSFEQQHGMNGWVSEFEQSQLMSDQMRGMNMPNLAAMEQTRQLAQTLSRNEDPKFQVKPASAPGDWATEYEQQYMGPPSWADQFANEKLSHGPEQWANEFSTEREHQEPIDDQWVNEFSKLRVDDWVDEFAEGPMGDSTSDAWANAYDEFLNERNISKQQSSSGVYVFSDMNPYVGHPDPLKEGQELFRKGLLSEAVLALEAEVMKNPENAEGWRLLGITHAENDDDQQAIAAMMRAHEADSTNLEVLLALGVSHTNELEQAAALKFLYGWLRNHPKYGAIAPPELADSLYHADIARLFDEASQMAPEDADVHIVLGVLYNLSREYDKAIGSFQTALKLKPNDYSLWNKLGATQANSVQSADAILAYQRALDLKPNYVRAWANMGISYANQGMYKESIPYYVRALAMNPKADNAWQYLKISLSCASRQDMLQACESRNLDLLQKEFPL
ncbi:PREDICTED: peroxisome biogenesis protein 5 isoform X2 [Tarenaya hassleriana]|uniref:peroxisome biogenesis protein 5 isoform X2 n=1 Tax=Tarenaya hassleriana TaxID=28532 RepID=UPI00053C413C|nr:PREDICTED: peroxisome biogenesis protein 5 isoform X2 [Tarenaya hassleriana]